MFYSIRKKLIIGFLSLVTMLLFASIWSVYYFYKLGTSVDRVLRENYQSIRAAELMMGALERQDSGVLIYLNDQPSAGERIFVESDSLFLLALREAEGNITLNGEQDVVTSIRQQYNGFTERVRELIGGALSGSKSKELEFYFSEIQRDFEAVKRPVFQLLGMNQENMFSVGLNLRVEARNAALPVFISSIAAIVFTLILSWTISRFMVSPIRKISKAIKQLIEGQSHIELDVHTGDEIQELGEDVNRLASYVRGYVSDKHNSRPDDRTGGIN